MMVNVETMLRILRERKKKRKKKMLVKIRRKFIIIPS